MKTFEEFEALLKPTMKGSIYVIALYEAYKMGWADCADAHLNSFVEEFKKKDFAFAEKKGSYENGAMVTVGVNTEKNNENTL